MSATVIREKHRCTGLPDSEETALGTIVRCDECGRFIKLVLEWGLKWRYVGPFTAWRLRRQLRMEGEK